jgi:acyl carrier protein
MTTVPTTTKRDTTFNGIVATIKEIVYTVTGISPDDYTLDDHFKDKMLAIDDFVKADILHLLESEYDVVTDEHDFKYMLTPKLMAGVISNALFSNRDIEALRLLQKAYSTAFGLPADNVQLGKHLVADLFLHGTYIEEVARVLEAQFGICLDEESLHRCETVEEVVSMLKLHVSL